jgi:hypothetical protein
VRISAGLWRALVYRLVEPIQAGKSETENSEHDGNNHEDDGGVAVFHGPISLAHM